MSILIALSPIIVALAIDNFDSKIDKIKDAQNFITRLEN